MDKGPKAAPDVTAWGFLLAGLAFAGCLLSHDPTLPPPGTRYPPPGAPPSNLFGAPGGWFAAEVFSAFGNAAYLLPAAWFAAVLALLRRRDHLRWSLRVAGWVLLTPTLAILEDSLHLAGPGGSPYGPGGSVGAWLAVTLDAALPPWGTPALAAVAALLGSALALDAVLLAAWRLAGSSARAAGRALAVAAGRVPRLVRRPGKDKPAVPVVRRTLERKPRKKSAAAEPPPAEPPGPGPEPAAEPPAAGKLRITRPAPPPAAQNREGYELPALALLDDPEPFPYEEHDQHLRDQAVLLEKTFRDFDLNVRVVGINTGPVITQYELALETGLRVNKVTALADDIALNMKVASVRMVAPIPGKNTVGVEVPNEHRAVVRLKEVVLTAGKSAEKARIPLFLGKDSEGRPLVHDLAEMPHLLIAGRTGTGKSVCLNSIILSILMNKRPDEVKLLMIDPKRTELSDYGQLPHLMHPVVIDMKKAEAILAWAVDKMEERYDLLSRAKVRSIAAYNQLSHAQILKRVKPEPGEEGRIPERMPYIVIVVDEMADLMMMMKREVEGHIIRLAQKSRAAGIHLVVATQKPTVDVITGLIKSNLPARVCFQVASRSDSRVVLDEMGADKLLGKGDMLFLQPGTSTLVRAQGTYVGDEEIARVVEALEGEPEFEEELFHVGTEAGKPAGGTFLERVRARDEVYEQAIEVVVREGRGSVSLLQRTLGIGYGRAARLIDFMAEDGVVGTYRGSNARDVLITPEEWDEMKGATEGKVAK